MSKKIFISYRRTQAKYVVGRIYDQLCSKYGKSNVFKDINSIPLGVDFREVIFSGVQSCNVLLVIISKGWGEITDVNVNERLHDENDFVRIEIEAALERKIPVIPIIIDNADFPQEKILPNSLKPLVFRNSIAIRPDPDFDNDIIKLNNDLDNILNKKIGSKYIIYIFFIVFLSLIVAAVIYKYPPADENRTIESSAEKRLINIQYQGKTSTDEIINFRTNLENNGFKSFGAEKMDFNITNMVKYFDSKDLNDATKLTLVVEKYFIGKGCPLDRKIKLVAIKAKDSLNKPPIEIWLKYSCIN